MKISAYIGSMRGEKSLGYATVKCIEEHISENQFNIFKATDFCINYCEGCLTCFKTGKCILDKNDNLAFFKDELIQSDLIIFSSPVYLHQVSGNMKSLIDRLSYWTHIFRLLGKRIIVCSETSASGNEFVISYLKKALSAMGGYVVGEIAVDSNTSYEQLETQVSISLHKLQESYDRVCNVKSTIFQEEEFYVLKKKYAVINSFESLYWKKNGFFSYNTFNELLIDKMR